jgi:hypothetical protein
MLAHALVNIYDVNKMPAFCLFAAAAAVAAAVWTGFCFYAW